ncbi:MAG: tRNA (N(6)-L-threonylcarbamoyladenosine(37)-C(2))-methylthiotransferase MtaB [Desulfotomaculum sp.]|nr:tRNA (N(6)-L-threonylcarbamoyladenosine(37)-C(2))-methylthiotransferase MtaB [Desulfotomaculum sp.]
MSRKKAAIYTLGCKVNQTESVAISEMFKNQDYQLVDFDKPADVYIINTCTVTHLSDRKSRQMIRRAVKINPSALVVVTGCYAQISADQIMEIPGVDLVVGTGDKNNIVALVEKTNKSTSPVKMVTKISEQHQFVEMPVVTKGNKTRGFIKVQEGCNDFCTYCIIPHARGPLRSRKLSSIITEVQQLLQNDFKEIVLTGIHTGAYGLDFRNGLNLATLVKELLSLPGLVRLRLSSVEPNDIKAELIAIASAAKSFCKHLHIPLQSGDDQILATMQRKYNTEYYARLINDIREKIPDMAITTDIMVGFPGESEAMFDNTYNFCRKMNFSGMHVFKYSSRKGTVAANFSNQVPASKKNWRSNKLMILAEQLAANYAANYLGQKTAILVEQQIENKPGYWQGLTSNYLRVEFYAPGNADLCGQFLNIRITKIDHKKLYGEII